MQKNCRLFLFAASIFVVEAKSTWQQVLASWKNCRLTTLTMNQFKRYNFTEEKIKFAIRRQEKQLKEGNTEKGDN